jgi:hypothetical protein
VLDDHGDTTELDVDYLAGCDGARSVVREGLDIGFPGGTYAQVFFVADVRIAGPFRHDLFGNLGDSGLVIVMPVRSRGVQRLIGIVPAALAERDDLSFDDFRSDVEHQAGIVIEEVNWFSKYRVHHRVADRFRVGRCFVAGDAGHIHSPAGGQGMNTGIGDAVNLGWKLAAVLAGRSAASLLDTYEAERIAFARKLVATTDRAFQGMVGAGLASRILRRWIVPHVMPVLFDFSAARHLMFETISQIRITYRASPLSEGKAGAIAAGDRLPWVASASNFTTLRTLAWQIHVYGELEPALGEAAERLSLAAHAFPWTPEAETAGLKRNAVYLIRPDGHVGWASERQDAPALADYVRRKGPGLPSAV